MTRQDEQRHLLRSVQQWFAETAQVEHYAATLNEELSPAEEWLLQTINPQDQILDIGCGAGRVALKLAQKCDTITAVDISQPLLQIAQKNMPKDDISMNFIQVDALYLPFANDTFDSALTIKVYSYIPTQELRVNYLKEIARILRPQGRLFMAQQVTPEEWLSSAYDDNYHKIAPQYNILEQGDTFTVSDDNSAYVHWFTEPQLKEEFKESGFRIEIFENDEEHGGEGYIALIVLQSSWPP